MAEEVTTVIGQLNIDQGNWRSDAPNQVAVREPQAADAPGAGKGDLFVLTEINGNVSNRLELEQQLAETVRDAYYLARGSVTASLRRALQSVGEQLYHHNSRIDVEKRIVAGVVILVMCGDDAFVAQTGSAAFFAVLGEFIGRYPVKSVWLDEVLPLGPEPESSLESAPEDPGLGLSALVEPNLHHFRVGPDDMLVLADSRLASQLPLEEIKKAIVAQNIKTAVKNLGKVAQAKDCSALLLAVIEQPQPLLGPLKAASPSRLSKLWPQRGQPAMEPAAGVEPQPLAEPVLVAESAAPRHGGSKEQIEPQPAKQAVFEPESAPAQVKADSAEKRPSPQAEHIQNGKTREPQVAARSRTMASTAREPSFQADPGWRRTEARSGNPLLKLIHWLGAGALLLITLLAGGLKTVLHLVLPNAGDEDRPQAGMQAHRPQGSHISWTLLRNIAIAIPILIGLIVLVSYLQKGRLREAEYAELVQTAQNKFQQSLAVEPASARALMVEAETLLAQAEGIKSDQPEIAGLRANMVEAGDKIGNVQRLYYLPQLRQYTDEGTNLETIVVQGVELYVLDAGLDRVYHHRLDNNAETLLPDDESVLLASRGQSVEEVTVGELLDMVWMPVGGNRQTSDLLILNSTALLEYNPNWGLTTAAIANGDALLMPVAISSYFGNLYILDSQGNNLWRYLPTADGYSAPPESYFPPEQLIDLSNAIDMAIDGSIYVLFKDGRISKFTSGQPVEFSLSGLDMPLRNPVSIFTAPDEEIRHVYVADAGNQRVVQFDKNGAFIRQFKPRQGEAVTFANLQDIYVDELSGRLYVLDSNNLYVGNIPSE